MLYIKSDRAIKPKRKVLSVSVFEGISANIIENILPYKYSPMTYNFKFDKGRLVTGMGFERARSNMYYSNTTFHNLPHTVYSIIGVWHYKRYDKVNDVVDDRIIAQDINGNFFDTYLYKLSSFKSLRGIKTQGDVTAINYRYNGEDVLLVSSEYGGLYMYNGASFLEIEDAPSITSMCTHYERIFATVNDEGNKIWFSDVFDPTNWNVSMQEGGFIELYDDAGRANKVVSFLDNVYIFRDYGINRLTAFGDQSEFSMAKLYINSSRIFPKTITSCGDRIIFMAEDGLYSFDGLNTRKIMENIFPLIEPDKYSESCYFNGKYYLIAKIKTTEYVYKESKDNLTNALIEYDLREGSVNILRGISIKSLLAINGNYMAFMFGIFRGFCDNYVGLFNYSGEFFGEILPKYWRSGMSDLGYKGKKTIRELRIYTSHPIIINIIADGKEYSYFPDSHEGINRCRVNVRGEQFSFEIRSLESKAQIEGLEVVIDY